MPFDYTFASYLLYLAISVGLTAWVARTLHRHGRVFLIDSFLGNVALADSINHLLVVGFYLVNIGYVTLALRYGSKPDGAVGAVEFLSTKVGLVLLVLGGMHFINMIVFGRMRRRAMLGSSPPPVEPDDYLVHDAAGEAGRGNAS